MNRGAGFSLPENDRLVELGRIAGGLVHEIKNPLGVVSMNADLLREQVGRVMPAGAERDKMERRLGRISESVRSLQAIVSSFLQFARPGRPDAAAVDLNAVIHRLIEEQSEANTADRVQVAFHPDEGLAAVPADPAQLAAVFRNILVNAREALAGRATDRRILITCWCTLQLEVYYRYLPTFDISKMMRNESAAKASSAVLEDIGITIQ